LGGWQREVGLATNITGQDYDPEEIRTLRIVRVHFVESLMLCLLSDGKVLCVPLTISPRLVAARPNGLYQYQIGDDGREVTWSFEGVSETLTLRDMLEHPKAEIRLLESDVVDHRPDPGTHRQTTRAPFPADSPELGDAGSKAASKPAQPGVDQDATPANGSSSD
jgi:hypothetical protein